MRPRRTIRKRIIESVLALETGKRCITLEEFRWRVFEEEMKSRGKPATHLTRSYCSSFNRTVRHAQSLLKSHQIAKRIDFLPIGVICRAAVHRMADKGAIDEFCHSSTACAYFSIRRVFVGIGQFPDLKEAQVVWCGLALSPVESTHQVEHQFLFPLNRPLRVVGAKPTSKRMLAMSEVGWATYRAVSVERFCRLKSTEPIRRIH